MEKLKILIGRSPQCDYTIENPEQHGTVSSRHATLTETDDQHVFMFEDHSKNGSYINGQLLHHEGCKVNISDHITLGKTYILPFIDIVKRYFMIQRTTKKKPQQEPGTPAGAQTNFLPAGRATSPTPEPQVVTEVVEKIVEKVPAWFWVLYVVSIIFAFGLGYIIFETY